MPADPPFHLAAVPAGPGAKFMVLMWDRYAPDPDSFDAAVKKVLTDRDYVNLFGRCALIALQYDTEYTEIFSVMNHISGKEYSNARFVLSAPIVGPVYWNGRLSDDEWDSVNRITGTEVEPREGTSS
jgi:hypothetical protein